MGKIKKIRPKKQYPNALDAIMQKLRWIDPFTYCDLFLEKIGQTENKAVAWPLQLFTAFITAWLIYFLLGLLLGTGSPLVVVVSDSMTPMFHRGDIIVMQGITPQALQSKEITLSTPVQGKELLEYAVPYCSAEGKEFNCSKLSAQNNKACIPETNQCFSIESINTEKLCFPEINECVYLDKEGDVVIYHSDIRGIPIIHRAVIKINAEDGVFVLTKGDSPFNPFLDQHNPIAGQMKLQSSAVSVEELEGRLAFIIPYLGYVKLIFFEEIPCLLFGICQPHQLNFY